MLKADISLEMLNDRLCVIFEVYTPMPAEKKPSNFFQFVRYSIGQKKNFKDTLVVRVAAVRVAVTITIILYHSAPKSLHCNEGERGGAALRISELERV